MSYEEYQTRLMPTWLQGAKAQSFNESLGASKDALIRKLVAALSIASIKYGDDEALSYIGRERGIERVAGESLEGFRQRLLTAWDFWRWAGTVKGLLLAFEAAGYQVEIYEHYKSDMSIWAQFSVHLADAESTTVKPVWDSGVVWDDGTAWPSEPGLLEPGLIMQIILDVKAAHAKPAAVAYYTEEIRYWDDGSMWDDGSIWDSAENFRIL